ncbi:hypothetical protein JTE90_011044 [Oedothorax gibbosus]|uniref:Uncharacterized protein n=1 Tax=Oedothorax gibbosus TaxID=931172 RepID=A0AAV6VEV1_9ARAC|nr:hypothetical protein JTE90_011044 [Oedothorax gibbosus]
MTSLLATQFSSGQTHLKTSHQLLKYRNKVRVRYLRNPAICIVFVATHVQSCRFEQGLEAAWFKVCLMM